MSTGITGPRGSRKPNAHQREVLAIYGALASSQAVDANATQTKPILIHDLVAFASGLDGARDQEIVERLGSDLSLRRQYRDLLNATKVDSFAKPRAAQSSDIFEQRIGANGVVLKLKAAKSQAGQYYLIIEVPHYIEKSGDQPVVLNIFTRDRSARLVFPALHDGRTQMVMSENDAVFALLQDHDLEIDIQ